MLFQDQDLTLPRSYQVLYDFFRTLDDIVSLNHNRRQRITAEQAAAHVQRATRRKFGMQQLKQIRYGFLHFDGFLQTTGLIKSVIG